MTAVRQRVPGVHDLISPEGRVCVELLDDRGRVKHKVKSENAIMNFWHEGQKRLIRGGDSTVTASTTATPWTGYHFHGTTALSYEDETLETMWFLYALQTNQPFLGKPAQYQYGMRNIMLTDSTEVVDPDEFIFPGNLTAYTNLAEQYAPAVNTKRGNLNTTTSYRTPTALRYVCEWGPSYGNGTHTSVGIGTLVADATKATHSYQCLMPYFSGNSQDGSVFTDSPWVVSSSGQLQQAHPVLDTSSGRYVGADLTPSNDNIHRYSGFRVSLDEFWMSMFGNVAYDVSKKNLSGLTTIPFSSLTLVGGHELTGPSMSTVGAGTATCGVAVLGTDLWLAYNGTLKRCTKPVSTSLTVLDTYTPGGIENCSDITTDGTHLYWLGATTVYKIDPATGSIVTSWAHGLTGNMGTLNWGGTNSPYLMVAYEATSLPVSKTLTNMNLRTQWLTALFTTAGTNKGQFANPSGAYSNSVQTSYTSGGLIMPLTADNKHWVGPTVGSTSYGASVVPSYFGPSHMSRTVLGSPVTKTVANSMRVTYEFAF